MTPTSAKTHVSTAGVIRADEVYTLAEFERRTGLSRSAVRAMRREGFRVCRLSKRGFVRGSDFAEFLQERDRP
jgi:hypothetical protein